MLEYFQYLKKKYKQDCQVENLRRSLEFLRLIIEDWQFFEWLQNL